MAAEVINRDPSSLYPWPSVFICSIRDSSSYSVAIRDPSVIKKILPGYREGNYIRRFVWQLLDCFHWDNGRLVFLKDWTSEFQWIWKTWPGY